MKVKNKHLAGVETLTSAGSVLFDAEGCSVVSKEMAELLLQVPNFEKCDCECGACEEEKLAIRKSERLTGCECDGDCLCTAEVVVTNAPRRGRPPKIRDEE